VRCSSCEPLLDAYLEATLRPAQARQVAVHLSACSGCDGLLRELRVIDALLATASPPARFESDFTAGVLTAARAATPVVARRRMPYGLSLIAYLTVAWIAGLVAAVRWRDVGWPLGDVWQSQLHGFAAFGAVVRAVAPATPLAAAAVTGVLLVDFLLVCAMFYAYRHLRPRLATYLDRGTRS
jgi:Putative zinc-finger